MALCYVCSKPIEPARERWSAPTCEACSASGCPVQWEDGKPTERCEACDCMPPEDWADQKPAEAMPE